MIAKKSKGQNDLKKLWTLQHILVKLLSNNKK